MNTYLSRCPQGTGGGKRADQTAAIVVDHLLGTLAHGQENAGQVDVDNLLEVRQGHFRCDLSGLATGGEHQAVSDNAGEGRHQVDPAKLLDCRPRQSALSSSLVTSHTRETASPLISVTARSRSSGNMSPSTTFPPLSAQYFANANSIPGTSGNHSY